MSLHAQTKHALPHHSQQQALLTYLPPSARPYPPLHLPATRQVSFVLAPSLSPQPHYHAHFRAHASSLARDPSCQTLSLCVLLVARLTSNSVGELLLVSHSHTDSQHSSVPIVIAPPPGAQWRDQHVYISDWRYVPGGHFEALLTDVHALPPFRHSLPPYHNISPSGVDSADLRQANLAGVVTAKTPIVGVSKPHACFLLELCAQQYAVTLVFPQHAVKWWPYVHVDHHLMVSHLRLSVLKKYNDRKVLRVTKSSVVYTVPSTQQPQPQPQPQPQTGTGAEHTRKRARIQTSHARKPLRLVTYEGHITQVHSNGTITLDDAISVHPGPCQPPALVRALRKGATIQVQAAVLYRSAQSIALFATERCTISVLYFADVMEKSVKMLHKTSCWALLWMRWPYAYIAWAHDVYAALCTKLGAWLSLSGTQLDRCLMGSINETGLVQYVMHVQSGLAQTLKVSASQRRNFYDEFLHPLDWCEQHEVNAWFVPTIEQMKKGIDALWKQRVHSQKETRMFTMHELYHKLVRMRYGAMIDGLHEARMALIGRLQCTMQSDDVTFEVSDCTGVIDVMCIGEIETFMMEAIISVQQFDVVVSEDVVDESQCLMTVVFRAQDVKVLIDGPYVQEDEAQLHDGSNDAWRETASKQLGQQAHDAQVCNACGVQVCVFVRHMVCGTHQVSIHGDVLAVRRGMHGAWHMVHEGEEDDEEESRCGVAVTMRDEKAAMICAATVHEGGTYALRVAKLDDVKEVSQHARAWRCEGDTVRLEGGVTRGEYHMLAQRVRMSTKRSGAVATGCEVQRELWRVLWAREGDIVNVEGTVVEVCHGMDDGMACTRVRLLEDVLGTFDVWMQTFGSAAASARALRKHMTLRVFGARVVRTRAGVALVHGAQCRVRVVALAQPVHVGELCEVAARVRRVSLLQLRRERCARGGVAVVRVWRVWRARDCGRGTHTRWMLDDGCGVARVVHDERCDQLLRALAVARDSETWAAIVVLRLLPFDRVCDARCARFGARMRGVWTLCSEGGALMDVRVVRLFAASAKQSLQLMLLNT
eukprot:TRINITY_DN31659_c0_g2_i1.p1 TRINITY_DN31659_c0_g2~~TRINITY_DN31659_c0_g2_i1.p1  ORF type:complete len:1046 (+),score=194.67 TRINITY_DN31659_c0_g2_i1:12860-15997(+)